MKEYLTPEVNTILRAFDDCGYEIYLVGGCVRDAILHIPPHDIDFATNATPEQMKDVCKYILEELHIDAAVFPSGEKFGTLTFVIHQSKNHIKSYEITTYRADGRYEDGRHPKEVSYADTLEEDLSRRDFTMNAIAWSPLKGYIDPYHGIDDIKRKMIRAVGNPKERFEEDLLRILRLIRFSLRYFFGIDEKTYQGAVDNVSRICNVSYERIGKELTQILSYNLTGDCAKRTQTLLDAVLTHLIDTDYYNLNYITERHIHPIYNYHNPLLRWYSLFSNIEIIQAEKMLNRFALGSKIVSGVVNIAKAIKIINNSQPEYRPLALGVLDSQEQVDAILEYYIHNSVVFEQLLETAIYHRPVRIKDLAIDGNVVLSVLHIEEGKLVGNYLNECLKYVCRHPEKNTYADLVEYIEYMYYEE